MWSTRIGRGPAVSSQEVPLLPVASFVSKKFGWIFFYSPTQMSFQKLSIHDVILRDIELNCRIAVWSCGVLTVDNFNVYWCALAFPSLGLCVDRCAVDGSCVFGRATFPNKREQRGSCVWHSSRLVIPTLPLLSSSCIPLYQRSPTLSLPVVRIILDCFLSSKGLSG